jgi:hypothetical protein
MRRSTVAVALGPDGVEEQDQPTDAGFSDAAENVSVEAVDDGVEVGQEGASRWRDEAEHPSSVTGAPPPADEALSLEAIDQASDSWSLFDHPRRDVQRRQAVLPGAPKDPEHVVLLQREASGLDCGSQAPTDDVGGAQDAEDALLLRRGEGPSLPDLVLKQAPAQHGITLQINS